MKKTAFSIAIFGIIIGTQAQDETGNSKLNIKSIHLKHTTPSLESHDVETVVTLLISEKNIDTVNAFIKNSKINNTTSLYKYLLAVKNNDTTTIDSILNNIPQEAVNRGGIISDLSFHLETGQIIELSDVYRKFRLSNFNPDFTTYMAEKGTVINSGSPIEVKPREVYDNDKSSILNKKNDSTNKI